MSSKWYRKFPYHLSVSNRQLSSLASWLKYTCSYYYDHNWPLTSDPYHRTIIYFSGITTKPDSQHRCMWQCCLSARLGVEMMGCTVFPFNKTTAAIQAMQDAAWSKIPAIFQPVFLLPSLGTASAIPKPTCRTDSLENQSGHTVCTFSNSNKSKWLNTDLNSPLLSGKTQALPSKNVIRKNKSGLAEAQTL